MFDNAHQANIDLSSSVNPNSNLSLRWIGDVGRELLRDEIAEFSESAGAQLALEKFELDDLYSIIQSVLKDPKLDSEVEFIIPNKFKTGAPELPVTWFPGDAGGVRNTISTSKRIVITAIGHEDIPPDSLRLVGKVNYFWGGCAFSPRGSRPFAAALSFLRPAPAFRAARALRSAFPVRAGRAARV